MNMTFDKKMAINMGIVTGFFVACAIGYALYGYYKNRLSAQAYNVFTARFEEFEKIIAGQNLPDQKLIDAVAADYAAYKQSNYGGFLLALKADMEALRNNNEQALEDMSKAVALLSFCDPVLYYTYQTKYALMQIDSSDLTLQTKGRLALEKLALNSKNPVRDMALFYMGYQPFVDNDQQGMQTAWNRLFDNGVPTSIWGQRVQSLLNFTA